MMVNKDYSTLGELVGEGGLYHDACDKFGFRRGGKFGSGRSDEFGLDEKLPEGWEPGTGGINSTIVEHGGSDE